MSSSVEICNLALSHLGINKEISNIETERSIEALACRRFFPICRDATLEDFEWPFARRFADLALVEEDPTDEWAYSYRYPTNAITIRRILSGVRNDTLQSRVPYEIVNDDAGKLIYTDLDDASIEYTYRVTNSEHFSPAFVIAMSYRLAHMIAPRLTAGDSRDLGGNAFKFYLMHIANAKALSLKEEAPDYPSDAELIRGRE